MRRLIDATSNNRHKALVALCGLSGLRISEALAVESTHFDLNTLKLKIRGKGDVTREVPISPETWEILTTSFLKSYCLLPLRVPLVGINDRYARKLITDLGIRAGLQRRIASHDLRATFATAVYDKTKDMRLVQLLLGHSSVSTTELYVNIDESKLKAAVKL